jgi:hypothetical protein
LLQRRGKKSNDPTVWLRRLISAWLLVLQALCLQHVALTSHALDDAGVAFEGDALATDSHRSESGHVCADAAPSPEAAECAVLASLLTAATPLRPAVEQVTELRGRPAPPAPVSPSAPGVPLLALAPKASPPRS